MSEFDAVMLAILAVALFAVIGIDVWRQIKNGKTTLETAEEVALSVISHVALALVSDAERTYGSGTGELKMSSCIEKLIELLPASVVEVVPKEFLKENLEKMLEIAKEKWIKNPRLINQDNK